MNDKEGSAAPNADAVRLRKAELVDVPAIAALIALSARTLSAADYSASEIEAALQGA